MNVFSGLLLLFAAAVSGLEGWLGMASLWFWGLVLFFSLIAPGVSRVPGLDPVLWLWCSPALLPGIALAGAVLGRDSAIARAARAAALLAAGLCAYELISADSSVARYYLRWSVTDGRSERSVRFDSDACPICAEISGATFLQGYTLPGRRPLNEPPPFSKVAAGSFETVVRVPGDARVVCLNVELEAGSSRFEKRRCIALSDTSADALLPRRTKGG